MNIKFLTWCEVNIPPMSIHVDLGCFSATTVACQKYLSHRGKGDWTVAAALLFEDDVIIECLMKLL